MKKNVSKLLGIIALSLFLSVGCKAHEEVNIAQENKKIIIIDNRFEDNTKEGGEKYEDWKKYEKTKTIKKNFKNVSTEKLSVYNKHGNITVNVWDRNEIDIKVDIKIATSDNKYTEELLNNIDVKFNRSRTNISAETIREEENQSYNRTKRGKRRTWDQEISINYTINMPRKTAVDLELRYGNIILPRHMDGNTEITLKYGTLKGGKLLSNLNLDAQYSTVILDEVKSGEINLAYCSKSSIEKINEAKMELRYSSLSCEDLNDITSSLAYSTLKSKYINRLKVNCRYSNLITQKFNAIKVYEFNYSKLNIENQDKKFESLIIPLARYSKIKINLSKAIKPEVRVSKQDGIKIDKAFQNEKQRDINVIEYGGRYSNLIIDAL